MTEMNTGTAAEATPGRVPMTSGQAFYAAYAASHPYGDDFIVEWDDLDDGNQRAIEAGASAVAGHLAAGFEAARAREGRPKWSEAIEEWAVFYGGPDPDDCAGSEVFRNQGDAEEEAQWRIQSGIARRTVTYGPWEVMPAEDDGTEAAAIRADPETMAAIAEGEGGLRAGLEPKP